MTRAKPRKSAEKPIIQVHTAEARAAIPVRKAPYFEKIERGLCLGLRKGVRGMTWVVRLSDPRKQAELGVPEETTPTPELPALSYEAARAKAREWKKELLAPPPSSGPIPAAFGIVTVPAQPTVGDALDHHLALLETRQIEAIGSARARIGKIKREIGHILLADLTPQHLTDWLAWMVATPPQRRPKKDGSANFAKNWDPENPGQKRKRQSTANRCLADVLAALNRAYANGWIDTDRGWRAVEPFPNATGVREEVLDASQQSEFLNGCTPEIRPLAYAALLTGNRYGPMRQWKVKDFRPLDRCVVVGWDKRHERERRAPLSREGVAVFHCMCEGRDPEEYIFLKANGEPWGKGHQLRPMAESTEDLDVDLTFYGLRHTCITRWLLQGVDPSTVASAVGTSTQSIERHYKNPRVGMLAKELDEKTQPIGDFGDEIEAINALYESQRLQRIEGRKTLNFSLQSLHPRTYVGKVNGGVDPAPPPRPKPTPDELRALVQEMPVSRIGAKYGVSGATARKWCDQAGVEVLGRGGWAKRRRGTASEPGATPRRPSRDELEPLIQTLPANVIALRYGTTGPTVLKWALTLGISTPGPGHWQKVAGQAYQEEKRARKARRRAGKPKNEGGDE